MKRERERLTQHKALLRLVGNLLRSLLKEVTYLFHALALLVRFIALFPAPLKVSLPTYLAFSRPLYILFLLPSRLEIASHDV